MVEGAASTPAGRRRGAPVSLADLTCRAVPTLPCRPGGVCAVLCPTRRPSHAKWFTPRAETSRNFGVNAPHAHRNVRTYRPGCHHVGAPDRFVGWWGRVSA